MKMLVTGQGKNSLLVKVNKRLECLYAQEKVACDMGKSATTEKEKDYYKQELLKIRNEIDALSVSS